MLSMSQKIDSSHNPYQWAEVGETDLAIWKQLLQCGDRGRILRYIVSGQQHRTIDDQKVGVSGRQAPTVASPWR